MRHVYVPKELTSRKKAEEIPEILEQMSVSYPDRNAIDVLAATNMLSVGVDIDRLDLMVIRGQPKLTSEYIQVSSRIGRRYPGLVFTLYNSAKTRDRAHYERFRSYHESFYRNVEPSSVTPFSAPSRARALSAVLITMFRHGLGAEFGEEGGASLFNPDMPEVKKIKEYIINRVKSVDDTEVEATAEELDKLFQEWRNFSKENNDSIVYKVEKQGSKPLTRRSEEFGGGRWVLPTSMRNVDVECNVEVRDE
jgi:superfamily II DNA/RNA helicase